MIRHSTRTDSRTRCGGVRAGKFALEPPFDTYGEVASCETKRRALLGASGGGFAQRFRKTPLPVVSDNRARSSLPQARVHRPAPEGDVRLEKKEQAKLPQEPQEEVSPGRAPGYDPGRPLASLAGVFWSIMARPERFFASLAAGGRSGAEESSGGLAPGGSLVHPRGRPLWYLGALCALQALLVAAFAALVLALLAYAGQQQDTGGGGPFPGPFDGASAVSVLASFAAAVALVALAGTVAAFGAAFAAAGALHLLVVAASAVASVASALARAAGGTARSATGRPGRLPAKTSHEGRGKRASGESATASGGYGATLAVVAYSATPLSLWFVPILGAFCGLYSVYLLYRGLRSCRGASRVAALAAVLALCGLAFMASSAIASAAGALLAGSA